MSRNLFAFLICALLLFPPERLLPGQMPPQLHSWAAVGNTLISGPISAKIAAAVCSFTPGSSAAAHSPRDPAPGIPGSWSWLASRGLPDNSAFSISCPETRNRSLMMLPIFTLAVSSPSGFGSSRSAHLPTASFGAVLSPAVPRFFVREDSSRSTIRAGDNAPVRWRLENPSCLLSGGGVFEGIAAQSPKHPRARSLSESNTPPCSPSLRWCTRVAPASPAVPAKPARSFQTNAAMRLDFHARGWPQGPCSVLKLNKPAPNQTARPPSYPM